MWLSHSDKPQEIHSFYLNLSTCHNDTLQVISTLVGVIMIMNVRALLFTTMVALCLSLPYRDQLALVNSLEVGRNEDPTAWTCVGCDDSNRPLSTSIIDNPSNDVKSIISVYAQYTVLAFRYTATAKNLFQDVLWSFQTQDEHAPSGCKVQREYDRMWNSIRTAVLAALSKSVHTQRLLISGISLGGGLAVISYVDISRAGLFKQIDIVTFGAPRVGNKKWSAWFDTITPSLRYFIQSDPIALLPRCLTPICNYRQTGTPVVCYKKSQVCKVRGEESIDIAEIVTDLMEEAKEHQQDPNGIIDHITGYKKIINFTLVQ